MPRLLSIGVTGLFALFLLGQLVRWGYRRSSRRSRMEITADASQRRRLLAGMALDAVRHPGAWERVPGLWFRPFIPCLGARLLSLSGLIRLLHRDRLFVGNGDSALVAEALRSGVRILDRNDESFRTLFARLPGLRDLDELVRLRPVPVDGDCAGRLLLALDRLLHQARVGVSCHAVAAPGEQLLWDVDLAPIRPRRRSGFRQRFLAINPAHPWWIDVASLEPINPELALCLVADRVAGESNLVKHRAAALRRLAANRVVRTTAEAAGVPR